MSGAENSGAAVPTAAGAIETTGLANLSNLDWIDLPGLYFFNSASKLANIFFRSCQISCWVVQHTVNNQSRE